MAGGSPGLFQNQKSKCSSGEFGLTAFLVLAELLPWSRLCLGAVLVHLCSPKQLADRGRGKGKLVASWRQPKPCM